jgi:hypothetical protein
VVAVRGGDFLLLFFWFKKVRCLAVRVGVSHSENKISHFLLPDNIIPIKISECGLPNLQLTLYSIKMKSKVKGP